jgi:hypothetical protein
VKHFTTRPALQASIQEFRAGSATFAREPAILLVLSDENELVPEGLSGGRAVEVLHLPARYTTIIATVRKLGGTSAARRVPAGGSIR